MKKVLSIALFAIAAKFAAFGVVGTAAAAHPASLGISGAVATHLPYTLGASGAVASPKMAFGAAGAIS